MLIDLFREHLDALARRKELLSSWFEDKREYLLKSHQLEGLLIMAAGDGKRMKSPGKPKPLLDYHGRPLIEHILEPALMQFDRQDVMVMIQGDDSFAELQKHLDDKGVTVLYQASSVAKGYLSAFIKEFYLHWNSNVLRQYRKLAIFPADIVFEKEPDFKGMLSHMDNRNLVLVMANQEGSEGRMLLKKGHGDEKAGWLEDFRAGKLKESQKFEPAVHTGGFLINTDLLYNPLKLSPPVLAFLANKGSIAAKKIGYYFIDGKFEGINTPEDLSRKPEWEINKPLAP